MSALLRIAGTVLNRPLPVRRAGPPESIAGKWVLVTGASAGIGRAAAGLLAREGATVLLAARREAELARLAAEIAAAGGAAAYRACDLADRDQVDALVGWVRDRGGVDVLVNNAGRSMRRPVAEAVDRPDDLDRAVAVNYLGPARLTLGLLPAMLARGSGHVVNVATWSVPVGVSPRFAAYHGSKAALTGFGRSLDAELAGRGVRVTAVHFPLVHTAMSAPTGRFRVLPGLTAEEAATWIATAIRHRPVQLVPRFTVPLRLLGAAAPRAVDRILLRWG